MRLEIKERIEKIKKGEVPAGYKRLDGKVIPSDWGLEKLGEISTISSGGTPNRNVDSYWNGNIPWVTTTLINFSEINNVNEYITEDGLTNSSAKMFPPTTILMAMYGQGLTRGKVGILGIRAATNQACCAILIKNEDVKYVYYYLEKKYFGIRKLSMDGNQKNLNAGIIGSITVPIASKVEQQKIASILSTWDKAIELKEKLIEQKKEQKRGLMKNLLTGEVRLPGFEGKRKEVRLGDLFDRVIRKNSEGNSNVLTISAQRGLINQEDFFNKTVASSILDNYYLLKEGEFAYNKSYSNGYPMGAIKRLHMYESGVVTTLYICFRLKKKSGSSVEFFEQYFESGLLNKGLTQIAHEGGRAHGLLNVSPMDFFNLTLTIPEDLEQKSIAQILLASDKEITLLQQELQALKLQKKGLMQLLLTGIVRVQH
ncbi:MAG: restriction endonuclease subunit S [Thermincolia bacterium]